MPIECKAVWVGGLVQPEALAVMVMAVPEGCGEVGAAEAVTPVHGVVVSV